MKFGGIESKGIVGVDPGLTNIGFAYLKLNKWKLWTFNCQSSQISFVKVYDHVNKITDITKPAVLIVESLPTLKNPHLMVALSGVVAAVGIVAYQRKLKFATVLPMVWKKAMGGFVKGMSNEELIANRYKFTFPYDEHSAAACGVITSILEEGNNILYGRVKWYDFSES